MRRSVISCIAAAPALAVLQSRSRDPTGTRRHRTAVGCEAVQPVQQRGLGVKRAVFIQSSQRSLSTEYELDRELGSGGFGTVVVGKHKRTGLHRAIKVIPKAHTEVEAFRVEVEALMDLDHPHIVKIIDTLEDAENFYLVQELCVGPALLDYVVDYEGDLPEREASIILRQCLKAILCCHVHGFIHRDVKLENFMLSRHGTVKLIDFGLSTRFVTKRKKDVLRDMNVVGTPDYIAPEMYVGTGAYDKAVDLWSLGVVLFSLLSKEFVIDYDPNAGIVIGRTYEMKDKQYGDRIRVKAMAWNPDGTYLVKASDGRLIDRVLLKELSVDIVSIARSCLEDRNYVTKRIQQCRPLQDRSEAAMDLLRRLLHQDPRKRISVAEALVHPFVLQWGQEPLRASGARSPSVSVRQQRLFDRELHEALPRKLRAFAAYSPLRQVALLAMAHLSSEELAGGEALASVRMSFRSIDQNGDGEVTLEELRESLVRHGVEVPSDLDAVFSKCDVDNSGKLNYVEFVALAFPAALMDKRLCSEVFRLFDVDNNGVLDASDFRVMLRSSVGDADAMQVLSEAENTLRPGACKHVLTEEDFQRLMLDPGSGGSSSCERRADQWGGKGSGGSSSCERSADQWGLGRPARQ